MDERSALYRSLAGDPIARRVEGLPGSSPWEQAACWALAPAVGAFSQWVLGRALQDGVRRLYFLSRDGWHFYHMAQRLCRAWGLPVECRYLYGSRYAWRLPLYHTDHQRALSQLESGRTPPTAEGVLRQAGLSPEERAGVLGELAVSENSVLCPGERRALFQKLKACPRFLFLMDRNSRQALPGLAGYLRQEGLLEGIPWALVDSGWMGSTQETLAQALALLGAAQGPRGYYWGLYRAPQLGRWACYSFSPGRELKRQAGFCPGFFEAALAAPQGMALGYEERRGRFIPRLGDPPHGGTLSRELEELFADYGEKLLQEGAPRNLLGRAAAELPRVCSLLEQLMTCPTRQEASAFGALPFWDSPLEGAAGPLASPPGGKSPWPEGSAALYGKCPKQELAALRARRWARVFKLAWKA